MRIEREAYYPPQQIFQEVRQMIQQQKLLENTFDGNKFYLRKLNWHKNKN